jgi:hypothetical protein
MWGGSSAVGASLETEASIIAPIKKRIRKPKNPTKKPLDEEAFVIKVFSMGFIYYFTNLP